MPSTSVAADAAAKREKAAQARQAAAAVTATAARQQRSPSPDAEDPQQYDLATETVRERENRAVAAQNATLVAGARQFSSPRPDSNGAQGTRGSDRGGSATHAAAEHVTLEDEFAAFCAAEAKAAVSAAPAPRTEIDFFRQLHPARTETLAALQAQYSAPDPVPADELAMLRVQLLRRSSQRVARVAALEPDIFASPVPLQTSTAHHHVVRPSGTAGVMSPTRLRQRLTPVEQRYHAKLSHQLHAAEARCAELRAQARRMDEAAGLVSIERYRAETGDANATAEDAVAYSMTRHGLRPSFAAGLRAARQHIAVSNRECDKTAAVMWEYYLQQLGAGAATIGLVETIGMP
jgi:hypothetical protein